MSPAPKSVIAVFGGSGYVGSAVIRHILQKYPSVSLLSISRSGRPSFIAPHERVEYVQGDISESQGGPWVQALKDRGVQGAISCVGAFGSDAFMLRVNGDANVNAIRACKEQGVSRFVYVSTADNTLPESVLRGYFQGKRQAEAEVHAQFPNAGAGTVLRPGFVYGTRQLSAAVCIPLGLVGRPLAALLSLPGLNRLQDLPGMKAVLCAPVSVEHVAAVAAAAAMGDLPPAEVSSVLDGTSITAQGLRLC